MEVKDFTQRSDKERIVSFSLLKKDRKRLAAFPHMIDATIQCRLIKVEPENGEKKILCTSLADTEKYVFNDLEQLYHYRWNELEACKLLKSRVEVESFSEKTAREVKQDFFAKVFLMTLCAAYAHPIEEKVIAEYEADQNRKHSRKINLTNALSMKQNIMVGVMIKN